MPACKKCMPTIDIRYSDRAKPVLRLGDSVYASSEALAPRFRFRDDDDDGEDGGSETDTLYRLTTPTVTHARHHSQRESDASQASGERTPTPDLPVDPRC